MLGVIGDHLSNRLEGERIKAQPDGLEMRYRERKEAVDEMESRLKHDVKPDQLSISTRILAKFKECEQFDWELERYEAIQELLNVKGKE